MKYTKPYSFAIFALFLFLTSFTLEKRVHTSGCFSHWHKLKNENNGTNTKLLVNSLVDKKTVKLIDDNTNSKKTYLSEEQEKTENKKKFSLFKKKEEEKSKTLKDNNEEKEEKYPRLNKSNSNLFDSLNKEIQFQKSLVKEKDKELYKRELIFMQQDSAIRSQQNKISENLKEIEIQEEKMKKQESILQNQLIQIKSQKNLIFIFIGIVILVTVLLVIAYRNFRQKKTAMNAVVKQKELVELANKGLEEKNREIRDSITYAKRIQTAILPPPKLIKEYLEDSFVLYKPKDVVAGDFYWLEPHKDFILFAAADCTGHGVPGAMVSVICNNSLNRSVREFGLTKPGEILTKTREIVIEEFKKSEEEVKDGMDIALCCLSSNKLTYAGAHNPLWIIRKGSSVVEEIKANKQPIGKFSNYQPFTTHETLLNQGDTFYTFTDGYSDQFGGGKGKKYKAKNFKNLLLSIQDKTMSEQKNIIDAEFEQWKGTLEQIDDVCIIGVRF